MPAPQPKPMAIGHDFPVKELLLQKIARLQYHINVVGLTLEEHQR